MRACVCICILNMQICGGVARIPRAIQPIVIERAHTLHFNVCGSHGSDDAETGGSPASSGRSASPDRPIDLGMCVGV